VELAKPWVDEKGYIEARLREALYEAELAREFLRNGLVRNAAGKAYQAWKAVIAALAAERREAFAHLYTGVKRLREGKRVSEADWVIAFMPSTRLREVAKALSEVYGDEVYYVTEVALSLHEYQYNGPDREGVFSRYRTDKHAAKDIEHVLAMVEKYATSIKARLDTQTK